ncbi:hypothetical protein SPRG_18186 [Saprolegnia parasitica CBS 223.65]|uniref:Uncharacterized protein n=1 Tax=Saprolegnia parasitica (strain CBS 223.65) TaxID=695850 RepID=A0A067BD54_SAPPC|nr:hypothetical protein SPRG_18186 [Saprolegnia parasitica CBS 223.65]KDO16279.1 hypothetical protein SPRG_18186 [Saprolegnia parasitica CBS 223.65]|eukprot:XP_012213013.1 hypothetical protein SPRG_18186 [Saprolegnia parasitica CBS 223.65]
MTQGRTVQFDDCGLHTEPARFTPVHHGHMTIDLDNVDSFWHGFEYLWLLNLYPSAASWRDVQHQLPPYTTTTSSTKLIFGRIERATCGSHGAETTIQQLLALDGTETPWRLPLHGRLRFEFTYKPQVPYMTEIAPDAVTVFWQAFSALEFDSDRAKYIQHFLHDHYITASQAQYLLGAMTTAEAHALVAPLLLQRVVDTAELFHRARHIRHQAVLKERAGKLLFFDPRLPNGRYALDLAMSVDKRLASTLLRLSADDRLENKKTVGLNTSQHGNWECFRNQTLDGAPYSVSRAQGLPSVGTFAFDFVVTTRIPRGSAAIPDDMLGQLCLTVTTRASAPAAPEKTPTHVKVYGKKAVEPPKQVVHPPHPDTGLEHRKLAVRQTFSEATFGISSTQLVRLANCFHDVAFGPVEIVAMLLNRVLDLDDLLVTLATDWTRESVMEAIHRIGWLNLWNPMFAEMEYHLNLSVWEEYQVTLMLAQLGDIEPGENWVDERFNDQYGWELPLSWVQGRIPHTGDLFLRYTTGATFKNRVNAAREDMKKRVLCGKPRKVLASKDNDGSRYAVFAPTVAPATPRRQSIMRAAF